MNPWSRDAGLVAYRAFSDAVAKGSFFVVTIIAARRLSQSDFGIFALGATAGWLAAVASDFGIQLHLARAIAQNPSHSPNLVRFWLRIRLGTAALAFAIAAPVVLAISGSTGRSLAILLLVATYLVSGLVEFLSYIYRGLSRSDIESTIAVVQRLATLVLAVSVLWWRPDVTLLAIASLLPALGAFACSAWIALRLAGAPEAPFPLGVAPGSSLASLASILPMGAGIVLSALYFRIDVFLIEWWAGTAAVGLYNAVFRLVEALRLFPAAVLAVAMPVLFRATTRQPLMTIASVVTAGACAASLILWIAADWLIPMLYGATYAAAAPAFRVLLLAFPLMSLNYALTHQLIGWHGQRAYAVLCALALVVNVLLNARFISGFGIVAAAWTTLATEAVLTTGCLVALGRQRGVISGAGITTLAHPAGQP